MGRKFDSLVFSSRKRDQMYNNMTSAGIILVAFANLFRVRALMEKISLLPNSSMSSGKLPTATSSKVIFRR